VVGFEQLEVICARSADRVYCFRKISVHSGNTMCIVITLLVLFETEEERQPGSSIFGQLKHDYAQTPR
jgi:hypothetical protein